MKKILKEKYKSFVNAKILYTVVICIAISLLAYIGMFQNVELHKVRSEAELKVVEDIQKSSIANHDAPIGVEQEYKWILKDIDNGENCLAFYVVHQFVEVYFDGELIYSLKPQENNKIGKTTASNWIMTPIYPKDEGTEVCVNIIPAYEEVQGRTPVFLIGSKFSIYLNQFKIDLPQIILSIISIAIGIVFLIISIVHRYKGKENTNLIYLGIFSVAIGIWKITDIRFAPLMFTKNTLVLSYISIMMIILSVVPLLLSIKRQFLKRYYYFVEKICIFYCCISLLIILLQITNIMDLRQSLLFSHIIIGILAVIIIGVIIIEGQKNKINKRMRILYICLTICIFGVVVDMAIYYIQGHSGGILYTLIAFLIYIITMGYICINDINEKANIDIHTGLFNKSRCNEILDENDIIRESLGIIMFDLNRLKYTNDTFGHEAGDNLISEFAKIIKNNIPNKEFVGRYGGDEFIAVIKEADNIIIEQINDNISKDVGQYNKEKYKISMSYSMGYALATDYPDCTLRELLEKADSHMYSNKKVYYTINNKGLV